MSFIFGIRWCAGIAIERTRSLIKVTGAVVKVNPFAAANRFHGVTNPNPVLENGVARCEVRQRHLVTEFDRRNQLNRLVVASADDPHNRSLGVVEERGDVIAGIHLETLFHDSALRTTALISSISSKVS